MLIICYVALIVGSIAIASIVYTLVMFGWCSASSRLPRRSSAGAPEVESLSLNPYLASRFQYNKKGNEKAEGGSESEAECVVCLSGFKDGDYICQLPRCKHSFHAPCIDMWLYSHSDCPVCRAPVNRMTPQDRELATEEHSREVLLDIRILS